MAEPRVAAVCFDLDGTLLDTLADLADSMNGALARSGFPPHGQEEYRLLIGDGMEALARRVLPPDRRGDDMAWRALVSSAVEEYGLRWRDRTTPYPGIPELLAALSARNVTLAVLSNKPEAFARAQVAHFFPEVAFVSVAGARPGVPTKPDPAAALGFIRALGIPARRWLFLGDSGIDVKTALGAGMTPLGALWGFRTSAELQAAGARHLLARPGDLLAFL